MFGNLGDMTELMKNARQMAENARRMQDSLRAKVVEAASGGGMVKARMNGAGELLGLEFEPGAVDPDDLEMLADLVMAAVNAARKKVEETRAESLRELTGGVDLSALGIDPSTLV